MLKVVKNQTDVNGIEAIRRLLHDDLEAVNGLIRDSLHSDVALINQLSHYIINSGGKRLRPMLVLLSANACRYPSSSFTRPPCCTTMSSMHRSCAAAT